MNKILVIGSINLDYVININNFPKPGETIKANNFEIKYGGKGANQAYYLAKCNSEVTFLSKLHNDSNSKELLNHLSKNKVNTKYIDFSKEATGTAIISVDKNSENSIIIIPGANDDIDVEYIDKNLNLIKENEYILLQNEIPMKTIEHILKTGYNLNKYTILNLAPASNLNIEYFKYISSLVLNESEFEFIKNQLNLSEDKEVIDKILELGTKSLILTLGSKGSKYIDKDNEIFVKAQKVNPIDTTGAGDSFIGAYFSKFNGKNFKESLEFATSISAKVIQYKGAQVNIQV